MIPDQREFGKWHPGWGWENFYLFYSVLAACSPRNPPGSWVTMYPQKKEASTYPMVSGLQWNSLISVTFPSSFVLFDIMVTVATPTLHLHNSAFWLPKINRVQIGGAARHLDGLSMCIVIIEIPKSISPSTLHQEHWKTFKKSGIFTLVIFHPCSSTLVKYQKVICSISPSFNLLQKYLKHVMAIKSLF